MSEKTNTAWQYQSSSELKVQGMKKAGRNLRSGPKYTALEKEWNGWKRSTVGRVPDVRKKTAKPGIP